MYWTRYSLLTTRSPRTSNLIVSIVSTILLLASSSVYSEGITDDAKRLENLALCSNVFNDEHSQQFVLGADRQRYNVVYKALRADVFSRYSKDDGGQLWVDAIFNAHEKVWKVEPYKRVVACRGFTDVQFEKYHSLGFIRN